MDVDETPQQRGFREQVRAWLVDHVPSPPLPPPGTAEDFAAHVTFERELYEAGYAAIDWPEEYGGRGADPIEQAIFEEEYILAGGPERVTVVGRNLLGPTLMVHGTPEQKQRWLPDILAARTIWVQGYSEPDAGSDLASLKTRAVRDGDDLILDGQKIWSSYGPYGDWIFVLARTNPDAAKHAGITFLVMDLDTPGVEVRPIVQPDGHAGFAEVFFEGARVPVDQVIGEIDDGWRVAMTALEFERDAPAAAPATYRKALEALASVARARDLADDAVVRDRLGELAVRVETYRLHALRALSRLGTGASLGVTSSMTKLLWSELERDLYAFGMELLGPDAELLEDHPVLDDPVRWHSDYWYSRAATIYAGTSEIQRNILARRRLGLPKGS
jgi:alkylation response protein AidB-like acyl-CoA dehydrogenase